MKIYKSINNNIVSAHRDDGREVVVIGKGIGFKAERGADIPEDKIEKVFVMSNQDNLDRLKELLSSLPSDYIELTDEILTYAKTNLGKKLNESAYITLADHIYFAVARLQQGMDFQNLLLHEIRRFYAEEFEIGLHALELMEKKIGVKMPEDEAASIAMHIYNAEYDVTISDMFHAAKLLDHLTIKIQEYTGVELKQQDYYVERFVNHLKFLSQRIVKKEKLPAGDDEFYDMLLKRFPEEMKSSEKIAQYISSNYDFSLSKEELYGLAIHMKRITLNRKVIK